MLRPIFRIVLMLATVGSIGGLYAADTTFTPPLIPARPSAIAVDASGNQYIAGTFSGTVDLNPGAGDVSRSSIGSTDVFLIRLNADGGFVWGHSLGSTNLDSATAVVLNGGFVYVAGNLGAANPSLDNNMSALTNPAGAFIAAFDAASGAPKGDFNGDGLADVASISLPSTMVSIGANLYFAGANGNVATIAKFDASTGVLDATFTPSFTGGTTVAVANIAGDGTTVYLGGSFTGTAMIGAGPGTVNSVGGEDSFVAAFKLSDGAPQTTFASTGLVTFGGTSNDRIDSLSISDGKILAGGLINSTDAGFGAAGSISRAGTLADGFVLALDSSGATVNSFESDGILLLSPPGDGDVLLVKLAAELGSGVTTPGIAVQSTLRPQPGVNIQVQVSEFNDMGAKRTAFGIDGDILFDGNSTETGVTVSRVNSRTTLAAFGNSSSNPYLKTNNLIPRGLGASANVVASFSSATGAPLFPHLIDVFPRADDVAGGRTVSFLGSGFAAGLSAKIATADVTGLNVSGGTKFTATIPPGTPGDQTVTITLANGRVLTTPNAFSYGNKATATGPVIRGPSTGAAVDVDGNTYYCGTFNGTVDFDPSAGSDMQRSAPSANTGFVTRFNANGSYGWTSVFVGLGNTTLNGIAVKGDRVFAVGDIQFANLQNEGASNAGINGLGNALCKGGADGAIVALNRVDGTAVTSVSGDGIVTVGGSTDSSFGSTDTLHSIAASPTSNMLAASGRMSSSNVGFNGLGAIAAGALFFNFDTDGNVTQNTSLAYAQTPPASSKRSALVVYSPDGTKLSGAVVSGNQVDVKQFSGNFGLVLNSFGTAGVKSNTLSGNVAVASIDESNSGIVLAAAKTDGTATLLTMNNVTGNAATPVEVSPKPGQTGSRNVENVFAAYSLDDLTLALAATGDVTLTDGTTSVDLPAQAVDQFDTNILIVKGTLANLLGLGSSLQVVKGDGGGREDVSALITAPGGVRIAGASSAPSTVVRKGTEEATPGAFKGFVFGVANGGGGSGPGIPPNITSATEVELVAGEEFVYTITATGTPQITYTAQQIGNVEPESKFNALKSSGINPISINLVGTDKLHVKSLLAGASFTVLLTASNAEPQKDTQFVAFTTARNPKAPDITLLPPFTNLVIAKVGSTVRIPYTLEGDQPIEFSSTAGTPETSAIGGTTVQVFVLDAGLPDTKILSVGLIAVNAFGVDIELAGLAVRTAGEFDDDGDGIPSGQDPDDDNDGFPDEVDPDPTDKNSKPSGVSADDEAKATDKSTSVQLNFSVGDAPVESILDTTTIEDFVPGSVVLALSRAAPKPVPGTLLYSFGGVVRTFTIDANGKGVSGNDKVALKFKSVKGVLSGSISVSIKNASIKSRLADEGLTDQNAKKIPLSVSSFIAYNGVFVNRTVPLEYTSKQGKKGSAKLKKK